jgi:hypothetical protein
MAKNNSKRQAQSSSTLRIKYWKTPSGSVLKSRPQIGDLVLLMKSEDDLPKAVVEFGVIVNRLSRTHRETPLGLHVQLLNKTGNFMKSTKSQPSALNLTVDGVTFTPFRGTFLEIQMVASPSGEAQKELEKLRKWAGLKSLKSQKASPKEKPSFSTKALAEDLQTMRKELWQVTTLGESKQEDPEFQPKWSTPDYTEPYFVVSLKGTHKLVMSSSEDNVVLQEFDTLNDLGIARFDAEEVVLFMNRLALEENFLESDFEVIHVKPSFETTPNPKVLEDRKINLVDLKMKELLKKLTPSEREFLKNTFQGRSNSRTYFPAYS